MNIKVRRIKLENRYSNVRTVRCDTLVVCKQVIKSKSGIQITLTISKSLNVTKFQIITENTNQFAQRFNLCSSLKIFIYKRIYCKINNLNQCLLKHIQLISSRFRECTGLFVKFLGNSGNVDCVVTKSLEVTDRMKELGGLLRLIRCHIMHT